MVVRRLDDERWPNKSDIGWSDHDLEIYDARWARLQLTTAAENHPQQKQMIRCRLRGRWSLRAILTFWTVTRLLLLLIGLTFDRFPWVWAVLVVPVVFAFYLRREQRTFQSITLVLLDAVAKQWNLTNVSAHRPPVIKESAVTPRIFSSETPPAPETRKA